MERELFVKAFEAGSRYANECFCGKCDYCLTSRKPKALNFDEWYKSNVPQPERKTAEEILREHCNFEFDRFNGEELVHSSLGAVTIAMQEYAAQGIASENTIPYIKSEHDHQLPRIAKIIGKDKFVFEQSINALLYIIETQGIDWPSEEEIKKWAYSIKLASLEDINPDMEDVELAYRCGLINGAKWLLNRVKK